jgi:hypothetical protein
MGGPLSDEDLRMLGESFAEVPPKQLIAIIVTQLIIILLLKVYFSTFT